MVADAPLLKPRRSLRLKLTLGLILIIGIIFAGLNAFNILSHRQARRAEALINSETIARLVAGALTGQLGSHNIDSPQITTVLNNFLTAALTLNARNQDLAFVLVVDTRGRLVSGRARIALTRFPGGALLRDEKLALAQIAKLDGALGGEMRTTRITLKDGVKNTVGRLLVGTSLARVERDAARDLTINLAAFFVALLVLIGYSSLALRRMVVGPLNQVVDAMRAAHEGDLEHELTLKRNDELGLLADTYNFMIRGLRERERLKDAFSRYVSPQVYAKFQRGEIQLAGEMREATVLFSDIRSFTALSEQLSPADIVAMLNEYFTEMVGIVFRHEGFVNKFIGDALMAIYNVPLTQTEPELRAVRTGVEMLSALAALNGRRTARGQFPLRIGIGINTGPVVAGNIGHVQRLEYTVIGDTVNLAQRVESQTKVSGSPLLISESTYRAVAAHVDAEALPPVKVKGKQEPVALYAVRGMRASAT
ncbi:MAG: adenylate/guanylate cyclase domain-containing protein [Myxococcota bacterium]